MNISKILAFAFGIIVAFGLTAAIGTAFNAVYLWAAEWLQNQGFSFWQTAWIMGMVAGFLALIRSLPDIQKSANDLFN
jgi:uncharacterized BrkB/YihY/UPF0761 family membrane protein